MEFSALDATSRFLVGLGMLLGFSIVAAGGLIIAAIIFARGLCIAEAIVDAAWERKQRRREQS